MLINFPKKEIKRPFKILEFAINKRGRGGGGGREKD